MSWGWVEDGTERRRAQGVGHCWLQKKKRIERGKELVKSSLAKLVGLALENSFPAVVVRRYGEKTFRGWRWPRRGSGGIIFGLGLFKSAEETRRKGEEEKEEEDGEVAETKVTSFRGKFFLPACHRETVYAAISSWWHATTLNRFLARPFQTLRIKAVPSLRRVLISFP